jgi:predicted ATPase
MCKLKETEYLKEGNNMENKVIRLGQFVLSDVEGLGNKSFKVDFTDGENPLPVVFVVGANGVGKTTLLDAINDMVTHMGIPTLYPTKIDSLDENNVFTTAFKSYIDKIICIEEVKAGVAYNIANDRFKECLNLVQDGLAFSCLSSTRELLFNTKHDIREFTTLSLGVRRYLINMVYMMLIGFRDGIILLDNPDCGIHVVVQRKLCEMYVKYAVENNCQIIIATHSPYVIDAYWEYTRNMELDEAGNILDLAAEDNV